MGSLAQERDSIYVRETWVNVTKGYRYGDSGVYESAYDNTSDLFRACQREYGRCVSRVYVDNPDGSSKTIGWCFRKRVRYSDSEDTYLQETWVELHEGPPQTTTKYFYRSLGGVTR